MSLSCFENPNFRRNYDQDTSIFPFWRFFPLTFKPRNRFLNFYNNSYKYPHLIINNLFNCVFLHCRIRNQTVLRSCSPVLLTFIIKQDDFQWRQERGRGSSTFGRNFYGCFAQNSLYFDRKGYFRSKRCLQALPTLRAWYIYVGMGTFILRILKTGEFEDWRGFQMIFKETTFGYTVPQE